MALPGSNGGLVVKSSDSQRVEMGAKGLVLKPQRIRTLDLHSYAAAMSLCFRAVELCASQQSANAASVTAALAMLQRECTRQYEELVLQLGVADTDKLWPYVFYARWTYMITSRALPTGFMADAAFLAAAKTLLGRNTSDGSTLHARTTTSPSGLSTSTRTSLSEAASWKICFKCGEVNTHKSPVCPVISPVISKSVRDSVRAAIASAPISDAARTQFAQVAKDYYAKVDRGS